MTSSINLVRDKSHDRYFTNPFFTTYKEHEGLVTNEWLRQQITKVSEMLVNREIPKKELQEGKLYDHSCKIA